MDKPMAKFKEAVIKLASSKQKDPLSASQIALIEKRLLETFPRGLRLPSHPPYASMIGAAIRELNEEGGSSEESISKYIMENYDDLPWAHKSILSHHLDKLCKMEGSIVLVADERYTVPEFVSKTVVKKGRMKRKSVRMKEDVSCEETLVECRVHTQGSFCGKEDGEAMSERALRMGRRSTAVQGKEENVGLDSCQGIEAERVEIECEDRVVVADKEDQKGEKSEVPEENVLVINKQSSSEMVKNNHSKCDQVLTATTENESLMDVCQGETRHEMTAMKDDNNGDSLMSNVAYYGTPVMTKMKISERENICLGETELQCDQLLTGRTDENPIAEEGLEKTRDIVLELEDDSNGGDLISNVMSIETSVKEKMKDAGEVKFYLRKRERHCNQPLTGGAENKSLVDECPEETVHKTISVDGDFNDVEVMNNDASFETPKKKDVEERSLVGECQEETTHKTTSIDVNFNGVEVMNNGASFETPTKETAHKTTSIDVDFNGVEVMNNGATFQTPTKEDVEEGSLVVETRKEIIALENDSSGVDVMNNDASLKSLVRVNKAPGKAKNRGRPRKRKYDQFLNGDCEEKSLVNGCQEENWKDTVATENDSTGDDLMNNIASFATPEKKKKDTGKVNTRGVKRASESDQLHSKEAETGTVVLCLAAASKGGRVINNGVLIATPVKKKKCAGKFTDSRQLVCGVATKLPELSEQRVTRQTSKSKEQPNEFIKSPDDPSPSFKLPKHENQQRDPIQRNLKAKNDWLSWGPSLLKTNFSGECENHPSVKGNFKNYCLDCNKGAFCTSCDTSHKDHRVIKIKNLDFDEDISIDKSSIESYVDITEIHVHKGNASDHLIKLKNSVSVRSSVKGSSISRFCQCGKSHVRYPSKYCSISCKHAQKLKGSSLPRIKQSRFNTF